MKHYFLGRVAAAGVFLVGLVFASSAHAAPTLNPTSVTVGLGQTATVTAQGSTSVYMSSNSNSSIASVQVNGIQITINGIQLGSATLSICFVGTASDCTNLGVTVQSGSVVTVNQTNVSLGVGQSTGIVVSGGNGTYSMGGNSNASIASAVLNANTVTVSGLVPGTTSITACDGTGSCASFSVTVTSTSSGLLSFSNANPTVGVGQAATVTVSGGSGYYVSSNSNPSATLQSVNDNVITITGVQAGTATLTVCSTSNGCGTLTVTVGSTNASPVTFGVTNPTITVGQTTNVVVSGSSSYFISSNPNAGIAQASINGSTLTLTGVSAGSASVTVCAATGGCATLTFTVTGQTTQTQTQTTTQTQTQTPSSATTQAELLTAIRSMQAQLSQMVTQIQSMVTTLTQLASKISVVSPVVSTGNTSLGAGSYTFTQFLSAGSEGTEVTALQQYLTQKGFYTGPITGYFGTVTESAVKAYQSAHGISALGYVGPSTRTALNVGE